MSMTPVCKEIRKTILNVSYASGHGHLPTCFSIIELLYAVYSTMKHDPANPSWEERDLFILSKGHGALALYVVLAEFGYFEKEELKTYGAFMSRLGCHPDRFKVPGIEVSTGSLGHGIGLAVGMALALSIKNSPRQVFTLIGDGESNEGSVWEAIMVSNNLQLKNLTILYDNNQSQTRSLPIPNPGDRFRSFGCDVAEVPGHDLESIKAAINKKVNGVKVIVADTVKGYGCKTLVDNMFEWHRKSPTAEQLSLFLGELDAEAI